MKQKVILISGEIKAGKSTLSQIIFNDISEIINGGTLPHHLRHLTFHKFPQVNIVRQYAYASVIKEVAKKYFEWDGKKDPKGRKLLQLLGTECGRNYKKDIWVNHFSEFMNTDWRYYENDICVYLIDDWRFLNEHDAIEFKGEGSTYKVRVLRDLESNIFKKIFKKIYKYLFTHKSENSLPTNKDYYDYVIDNKYKSIKSLKNSIEYRFLIKDIINFIAK